MLINVLKSLGYRFHPEDRNKMVKPCGSNIIFVMLSEKKIASYFYGANGKFLCWARKEIDTDNWDTFSILSRSISRLEGEIIHEIFLPHPPLGFLTNEEALSEYI
jgi:hypothetical protein